MALTTSGQIKLSEIWTEYNGGATPGVNQNVSLGALSVNVADGGTNPDAMSEFYGLASCIASTTKWLTGDNAGNLFYTQADSGLTGWTAGPQLGSTRGWLRYAVYNGSGWVAGFDNEVWATSDTSGTSGWTLTKGNTGLVMGLMWTGGGWIAIGRYDAFYCTDTIPDGSTSWTTFDLGNVNVSGGVANDGTNSFLASRSFPEFRIRWHLLNALTEPTSQTTHDIVSYFGRHAYFVPDGAGSGNDVYIATTTHPNSFYYTVGNSDWSSATVSLKGIGATASYFDYNDSYYAFADSTNCKITSTSGALTTGGYSSTIITSVGIDRIGQIFWNGTSWGAPARSTSGNTYFAVFRNASNPNGTWTGVTKPSGFNGTRSIGLFPSKRPHYNAITDLGC